MSDFQCYLIPQILSMVSSGFGISILEISEPSALAAYPVRVIALGKQLSKRWYVGYERGLNATAGSFQLIYRIAQRFTLRAQSGDDNSVDAIWTWRWK